MTARRWIAGALVAAAAAAAAGVIAAAPDDASRKPAAPRGRVRLGPTAPGTRIDFSVVLRVPGQARMERFLRRLEDPRSPEYRHFIGPAAFGARFGLPAGAIRRVEGRLESGGLHVTGRFAQRTAIPVRSSVGRIERFFHVSFTDFRDPSGRRYHEPQSRPVIPRDLRSAVVGLAGLDNHPVPLAPLAVPGGGLKPKDLAAAYDVTPLWKAGLHGEGQTVAIVSFASFKDSDVARFDRFTGTHARPVEHIPLSGGNSDKTGTGAEENNLDIDAVRGMAPQATILNYELPLNGIASFTHGIGTAIDTIVSQHRADIVSISWGLCDVPLIKTKSGQEFWLAETDRLRAERALQAAVAAGVTIFVSSGDTGAYSCQRFSPYDLRPTTLWPGDSPWVVSVGGTLLSVRKDGTYFGEAGWEDALSDAGGGGGLSPHDSRPDWQRGPGVANRDSNGKRQLPDVAATADPDSGLFMVWDGNAQSVGGTSAAAPFWAGITALTRQLADREHAGKLGYLNPVFYALAARTGDGSPSFHDVTRGGNRLQDAGPGWDYSTGLGSPDVNNLAHDVVDYLKAHG
jgi:subtilase family serine protease